MRLVTIFGTRPEIIRLSLITKRLDRFCENVLVHTGQNYDPNLSDIFFQELGMRQPDMYLGVQSAAFAEQVGQIIARSGEAIDKVRPDRVLILGDTNSGLAAIVAARRRIPVFHLEAGNRCYDDRVPEEVNRRIIDHCSAVLMPYTHRSKENLLREGIDRDRIFVVGNPINEVIDAHEAEIGRSDVLARLGLEPRHYFLATLHRAENIDDGERLRLLLEGLQLVARRCEYPMIVSLHPHTADRLNHFGLGVRDEHIRLMRPFGFFDFVALERSAGCVISDSGTVQEECCIFRVPSVTIRDVTERAETVECGSNIVTGSDPETISRAVEMAMELPCDWTPPSEYAEKQVSATVAKVVLGYHSRTRWR